MRFIIFLILVGMIVVVGGDFVLRTLDKTGRVSKRVSCAWQGETNWYGHCHPSRCPANSRFVEWTQVLQSSGWERIFGKISEFFVNFLLFFS